MNNFLVVNEFPVVVVEDAEKEPSLAVRFPSEQDEAPEVVQQEIVGVVDESTALGIIGIGIPGESVRGEQGEQGIPGPIGPQGPQGPAGPAGGAQYVHNQGSADTVWNVAHNLNRFPTITVVDSANTEVIGDVAYIDSNNVVLTFSAPFSGKAFCN